jgi:hypothetical protein
VARHVREIDERATVPNWRGWLPAGAVAAACLAVVMVSLPEAPPAGFSAHYRNPQIVLPQHVLSEIGPGGGRGFPLSPRPDPDDEENQDRLPRTYYFRSF